MRLPIDLSVVIPCYNSDSQLVDLVYDIFRWAQISKQVKNIEVLLVADGPETSNFLLRTLQNRDDRLAIVSLKKNVGEQIALIAGIESSKYQYVCTLDDDGQHPPAEIDDLIAELHRGKFDLVYGSSVTRSQPILKHMLSYAGKRLLSVFLAPGAHRIGSMRLFYKAAFMDELRRVKDPAVVLDGIFIQSSAKISSAKVNYRSRAQGVSGYNFAALANHAVGLAMSAARRPLRGLLWFGLVQAMLGALMLITVATDAVLFSNALPPWGLAVALTFLTLGVQFLGIAVVGELVSRLVEESRTKRLYEIEVDTN